MCHYQSLFWRWCASRGLFRRSSKMGCLPSSGANPSAGYSGVPSIFSGKARIYIPTGEDMPLATFEPVVCPNADETFRLERALCHGSSACPTGNSLEFRRVCPPRASTDRLQHARRNAHPDSTVHTKSRPEHTASTQQYRNLHREENTFCAGIKRLAANLVKKRSS